MRSIQGLRRGRSARTRGGGPELARTGFTLVELVLVLVLAVILSGLAVPSLSRLGQAKANITAVQVRSLVVYAQAWAIGTGRPTWVGYDANSQQIAAFAARDTNPAFAWRVALLDPQTRSPLTVDLSELFRQEDPIQETYGGDTTLKFDETGTPVDSNDAPVTGDVLIPLTRGVGVRVRAGTGLVSVY